MAQQQTMQSYVCAVIVLRKWKTNIYRNTKNQILEMMKKQIERSIKLNEMIKDRCVFRCLNKHKIIYIHI